MSANGDDETRCKNNVSAKQTDYTSFVSPCLADLSLKSYESPKHMMTISLWPIRQIKLKYNLVQTIHIVCAESQNVLPRFSSQLFQEICIKLFYFFLLFAFFNWPINKLM